MLTFDCVQNSVVQGLAARVIGGRADASSTTVGQSVPDALKQKKGCTEQRKTKIIIILYCSQIKKNVHSYIKWKLLLNFTWNTCRNRLRRLQTEGTNLSKKAASSLLSSTLCLVPALTWQFISWARDIYTEVPAKSIMQTYYRPDM